MSPLQSSPTTPQATQAPASHHTVSLRRSSSVSGSDADADVGVGRTAAAAAHNASASMLLLLSHKLPHSAPTMTPAVAVGAATAASSSESGEMTAVTSAQDRETAVLTLVATRASPSAAAVSASLSFHKESEAARLLLDSSRSASAPHLMVQDEGWFRCDPKNKECQMTLGSSFIDPSAAGQSACALAVPLPIHSLFLAFAFVLLPFVSI